MGVIYWHAPLSLLRGLFIGTLLWLALLCSTSTVQAQSFPPQALPAQALSAGKDQPCADCHEAENAAWHASPHATTLATGSASDGATCVDCHGAYIEEHPRADMMTLAVDSAICADCHETTFTQWEGSTHAEAEVQCISCHLSHSQELRLTDETLCVSCHQAPIADQFHTAHWADDVTCSACHLPTPTLHNALASSDPAVGLMTPSHDFVKVAAESCLDCHREDVQQVSWSATTMSSDEAAQSATLATQLQSAEGQLHTMGIMTPVALGIGVSLGGFIGIVFMLFVSRWGTKKAE